MILYIYAGLFGLLIGSFLNVCIWRIPRRESLWSPSSHCLSCQRPIRFYDNIPVLSFLILGGKCRGCGTSISWRYPLVELLNAAGYIMLVWRYEWAWPTAIYAALFSALIVITFVDLDHQIIPDRITLPGIVLGMLAAVVLPHGFLSGLTGLLLGGGLFYLIAVLSGGGMGGGDIKMIAMVGAFLGWKAVLMTIFVGATAGSIVGLGLMLFKGRGRKTPVPFGPFLSLGTAVFIFYGQEIIQWYLALTFSGF